MWVKSNEGTEECTERRLRIRDCPVSREEAGLRKE
jgi:hypothetical protein